MRLFEQLQDALHGRRTIDSLAEQVARRTRDAAYQHVAQRQAAISTVAEARGYVRAHCSSMVRVAADRSAAEHKLPSGSRARLVTEATERLIEAVARDLFCQRRTLATPRRAG